MCIYVIVTDYTRVNFFCSNILLCIEFNEQLRLYAEGPFGPVLGLRFEPLLTSLHLIYTAYRSRREVTANHPNACSYVMQVACSLECG